MSKPRAPLVAGYEVLESPSWAPGYRPGTYEPKLGISFRAHGRLPGAGGVGC